MLSTQRRSGLRCRKLGWSGYAECRFTHDNEEQPPHHRGLDPIQQSFREAPDFNRIWLTDKRPLTNVQRLGLTLLSAFMGLGGSMCASAGIADLREFDIVGGIFFTLIGLASLYAGLRGL